MTVYIPPIDSWLFGIAAMLAALNYLLGVRDRLAGRRERRRQQQAVERMRRPDPGRHAAANLKGLDAIGFTASETATEKFSAVHVLAPEDERLHSERPGIRP